MKKSSSHHVLSSHHSQQHSEETGMAVNPYYPHTLPFQPRPVPLPRKKKPLDKTQSSQHLSKEVTGEPIYNLPRPQLQHICRDRPIPLPRRTNPQTLPPIPVSSDANTATAEYTHLHKVQPKKPTPTAIGGSSHCSSLLTLEELGQSPQYLPATIETIDGFYGFGQQVTISSGERLSVHFVKHVKMVVLCDYMRLQYYVPLGSAMKFALPCEKKGEEFQRVSDIIKQKGSLPHVICSKQYVPRQGKQEAIEEGEILIIRQCPKRDSRPGIFCYSLRSDREFLLHKDCKGAFTAAPEKTSMYLLDIVKHLSHLFPCKVHLYPPASNSHYDQFTRGRVFILKDYTTVTSLVVSNLTSPESEFFDIVLDEHLSKLRVSLLEMQSATNSTYAVPRPRPHLYAKLISSDFASGFQNALYTAVRQDLVVEGTELMNSMTIGPGNEGLYDYIQVQPRHDYSYIGCRTATSPAEGNRDYLKSLSIQEVSRLLDVMGLGMYKTRFIREKVSGSFLAECSEHNLQRYLDISNHIHRLRLQQIISGNKSARMLLSEQHS